MSEPASSIGAKVDDPPRPAITHPASHLRFWIPAAVILWLDLWSKSWVFANLGPDEVLPILGRVFEFRRSINDGAVFGLFTGQVGLFIAASLFAFGIVFYMFAFSRRPQWALHVALGLILSGALGNLYDRAVMKADVVIYQTASGEPGRVLGVVISDSTDEYVAIGNWPEGRHPRRFPKDEVEVRQQGVVRDFIKFVAKFPSWVPRLGGRDIWPWVFNIADAALVCGVAALLGSSCFRRRARE